MPKNPAAGKLEQAFGRLAIPMPVLMEDAEPGKPAYLLLRIEDSGVRVLNVPKIDQSEYPNSVDVLVELVPRGLRVLFHPGTGDCIAAVTFTRKGDEVVFKLEPENSLIDIKAQEVRIEA